MNIRTGWYIASESFQSILQDRKKNHADTCTSWQSSGINFPRIQGADLVGKVVEIGDDVESEILNQTVIVYPWIRRDTLTEYGYIGSELVYIM